MCWWPRQFGRAVQDDRVLRPAIEQVAARCRDVLKATPRWSHRLRWKAVRISLLLASLSFLLNPLSGQVGTWYLVG